MFSNETDAYNYMWNNSFRDGQPWRENYGWITDKGIVVLPTEGYELDADGNKLKYYVNENDGGSPWYNLVDRGFVYHNNVAYKILASIHTHPNGRHQTPSPGDIDFVAEMGTIPHITIGTTEVWGYKYQGIEGAYINVSRFNFGTHQQIMSGTSIINNLGKL